MALVLVLIILVFVSTMVIVFMNSVKNELTSTNSYAAGIQSKQLAESAVQLVMAQITDATKGSANPGDPTSPKLAWASQPGMIRTYNDQGLKGNVFKLYSAANMVEDGATFAPTADLPAYANWKNAPGLYTDINQPALVSDPSGGIVPDAASGKTYVANYPIVDPSAIGKVEGFAIAAGGPSGYTGSYPPAANYNPLAQPNPVPMPTAWLYLLQDGKVVAPTGLNGDIVTFDSSAAISTTNPIVGRIAFWTDDETCKLNINTASEGTSYDVPRATIKSEIALARSMPIKDEFQRAPGHPAMTSLSPALGWVLPRPDPLVAGDAPKLNAYYDLTPRVAYLDSTGLNDYSSQGGTRVTMSSDTSINLALDGDRLYTSLDELVFNPARTLNKPALTKQSLELSKFFLTALSRAPEVNLYNQPRIGLWPLQAGTDVNPARTPPRDPKDKLLEFCTKIGGKPYYFQRFSEGPGDWNTLDAWSGSDLTKIPSALSNTLDFNNIPRNQQLYQYLQQKTAENIPGFGGNFEAKWTALGRDRVLTSMIDLMRSGLNTMPSGLPGGYHFTTLRDSSRLNGERFIVPLKVNAGNGDTKGYGRFSTVTQAAIIFFATKTKANPLGPPNVAPFKPPLTTEMQAILVTQPFQPTPGMYNWAPICRYEMNFNGGFSITTFSGSGGAFGSGSFSNAVNRLSADAGASSDVGEILAFGGVLRSMRKSTTFGGNGADNNKFKILDPNEHTGYPFYSAKVPVPPDENATFNFSGGTLTLKIRSGVGSPATATSGEVFQTITMDFPPINNLPVPQAMTNGALVSGSLFCPPADGTEISHNYNDRITAGPGRDNLIREGDIVRSIEASPNAPINGDLRLIAGNVEVPDSYFRPHPNYTLIPARYTDARTALNGSNPPQNAAWAAGRRNRYATSLRSSSHRDYQYGIGSGARGAGNFENRDNKNNGLGGLQVMNEWGVEDRQSNASTLAGSNGGIPVPGGLVAGVTYSQGDTPVAAHGTLAALMSNGKPGDWDSGSGFIQDGPYINKPDPGNLNAGDGTGGYWTQTTSNNNALTSFSPNRQVASALMFGSLPTPNATGDLQPWQTLLFCANPASKGSTAADHYGFKDPKDYLMLDLFTMPIVEPYAISEPLSTAGKVNLNYQIMPFTNISRSTAVRGVLKSVQLGAIATILTTADGATQYKKTDPNASAGIPDVKTRFSLNLDEATGTLKGFENRFATGDIFRSAAEICGIFLVPKDTGGTDPSYANISSWWDNYKLTGDNVRESPYNQIYPRMTTKSNSFTIHYKVQALKKSPASASTPVDGWNEAKESVVSEYRGSTQLERYVDASDPDLPDFITATGGNSTKYPDAGERYNLDTYYRFRVVGTKRFDP